MKRYNIGQRVRELETLEDPKPSLAVARYQSLPMLRGLWNFASVDNTGAVYDMSEQDRMLTYNGNPLFDNNGLVSYATLDGTGDYFDRADEAGLDITGTETYVEATKRGFSFGGWFNLANLVASQSLIGKWLGANDLSYFIYYWQPTTDVIFSITSGGTGATQQNATSSITIAASAWYFIAGTFDPSATLNIYINNTKDTTAVGGTANIFSGAADFEIGSSGGGATLMTGDVSYCFLCASFLSDAQISGLYQNTRALFGV